MAGTGEKYASVSDVKNLLVAFDKKVLKAQSTPLPSGGEYFQTFKEGVVGGKNVSLFITRVFKWSQLNSSHEYNLMYDDSVEDYDNFTEDDVIKEIMDVLRSFGWKPSMGMAIL